MTDTPTGAAMLRRNYLFDCLSAEALERVAELATQRNYSKGEVVFSQGSPGDALYGVVSGRVRISAMGTGGQEVFLSIMEPGDTFGEIAVMDGLPRTAGATALDQARLLVIKHRDFLRLLEREPKLAVSLLKLLCTRLRWTSELVEDSAFLPGPARLAKRLLVLASLHGHPLKANELELRISQAELAHFLGITRQVVNHHLREWQKNGWVRLRRNRVTICDRLGLHAFIARSETDRSG